MVSLQLLEILYMFDIRIIQVYIHNVFGFIPGKFDPHIR
jgi:hypothetical protein